MENMSTHQNARKWNRPPNTNKPDIFVTGWGNITLYPNILTVNSRACELLFIDDPPVIKHQN